MMYSPEIEPSDDDWLDYWEWSQLQDPDPEEWPSYDFSDDDPEDSQIPF